MFYEFLTQELKNNFKINWEEEEIVSKNLLFSDFMSATRDFDIIADPLRMVKQIAEYMYDTSINIELFRDAVNHLCRCCRALRQVRGHFL